MYSKKINIVDTSCIEMECGSRRLKDRHQNPEQKNSFVEGQGEKKLLMMRQYHQNNQMNDGHREYYSAFIMMTIFFAIIGVMKYHALSGQFSNFFKRQPTSPENIIVEKPLIIMENNDLTHQYISEVIKSTGHHAENLDTGKNKKHRSQANKGNIDNKLIAEKPNIRINDVKQIPQEISVEDPTISIAQIVPASLEQSVQKRENIPNNQPETKQNLEKPESVESDTGQNAQNNQRKL